MKKRILIIVALLVSVALLATGAFAYFTATRTATGTVKAGTLGILLASSPDYLTIPENWAFGPTTTPWDFTKVVPGESRGGCLWMMNTGDVGTVRALWDFSVLATSSVPNLADRLELTNVFTTDDNFNWIPSMWHTGWDPNNDGKITFQEVANYGGDWENDVYPFLSVAPGGKGAICLTFQMINGLPAEDNPYQGANMDYSVVVTAFNPRP
jgi:predicted ribosomally synthesized peptide with SipW-like signal peptide